MSNRNRDNDYSNLASVLRFALEQHLKSVNTCLPGHIVKYDAATRRASVRSALDILTTDGELLPAPQIENVPVVFTSGGGWTFGFPLAEGDPVLLVFAQRGLSGFKRDHDRSSPDVDSLFSIRDAIAIPGFGPTSITPGSTDGVTLQDEGGDNLIALEPDGIRIKTRGTVRIEAAGVEIISDGEVKIDSDGKTEVKASSVEFDSGSLKHGGTNVGKTHVHTGVQSGPGTTGPPR